MHATFSWSPLVWAMRILALLVVSGAGIIALTLIIRLMSPSNLSGLARGGLPAIRKGRFNVMRQELEISPVVERKQDEQIFGLERRVGHVESILDELATLMRRSSGEE